MEDSQFVIDSIIHGYHIYNSRWVECQLYNAFVKKVTWKVIQFAVAVLKDYQEIIGHVPRTILTICCVPDEVWVVYLVQNNFKNLISNREKCENCKSFHT